MHEVLSYWPEPQFSDEQVAHRLSTWQGRASAHLGLLFRDHHVLRLAFQNKHHIGGGLWRSNQPSPKQLRLWRDRRGVRTVINLRGVSDKGFHVLEREACERLGLKLITIRAFSRDVPQEGMPRIVRSLFQTIAYPAVMHCKSGADRVGLMSVLYKHFRFGVPIRDALEQLSWRYGHVSSGKTGILDAYFAAYLREGARRGLDLVTWSERCFNAKQFKADYRAGKAATFLTDTVLRRE